MRFDKREKPQWYWKQDIPFLQLDLGRIRTRLSTNEFLEVPDCIFRAAFDTDWRGVGGVEVRHNMSRNVKRNLCTFPSETIVGDDFDQTHCSFVIIRKS